MWDSVLNWVCVISPAIGASALGFIALVTLVAWRGGTISKIKIPGLFDVDLSKPIVFAGRPYMPVIAVLAAIAASGLAYAQTGDACTRCLGLPGETAWIYVGRTDRTGKFDPPSIKAENGAAIIDVKAGTWITLIQSRRTMILDYDTLGTKRALDSPFMLNGKVTYTCKSLSVGQRLLVADRKLAGPNPDDQHLWFRIRTTPIGG
ncbi:hypothetical protein N2603_23695 [Bradyrhizobium huanghuaihaiense]|uniref:hypothetical protein n=1 Tax=Bradyrhizobium huanghuaihaiense TaxID=990078 RepID=UPI0021A9795D|nr:hypothetical protein [Bradyrhizobium sp. CB3035]UWU73109.1 hypothetical protein N2603_23695 [Bradyrhizobium sp. CB3035]